MEGRSFLGESIRGTPWRTSKLAGTQAMGVSGWVAGWVDEERGGKVSTNLIGVFLQIFEDL